MEIVFIAIFALIIGGIAYLVHSVRKNKKTKTKEERRAESITAIIIILILAFIVFIKQTVLNNAEQDVIRNSNSSQTEQ
ncbi:MAG TPA: hypothetical protein VFT87_02540 [Candidatus Saccharimonadales bacterium]|nr:hypothetical protein [Candidatus Saccharimonadales bacterium]